MNNKEPNFRNMSQQTIGLCTSLTVFLYVREVEGRLLSGEKQTQS